MKIGLFFGSFNPVHTGHMIIANHVVNWSALDEVWMVVSPQNPLKKSSNLARDYDRLHMVQLAIGDHLKIRASNIEFSLPRPSYTVDTLIHLREKYPDHEFTLIMGGDNIQNLHKWKNHEVILNNYNLLVYKRPEYLEFVYGDRDNISVVEAPLMEISSTFIRKSLQKGKSVRYLVPDAVWAFLESNTLYRF